MSKLQQFNGKSTSRLFVNVYSATLGKLDRLIGYGPPDQPTEVLLRLHEREVSTNRAMPREAHYCHPGQGKWGAGVGEPFLDQLWGTK